jgi:hypothetical protein
VAAAHQNGTVLTSNVQAGIETIASLVEVERYLAG